MALPIGRATSRGIPPDRPSYVNHELAPNIPFINHTTNLNHPQPEEIISHVQPLFTFHLSDTSIVHTTHPDLQKLFNSLHRQLNYHVYSEKNVIPSFDNHINLSFPQSSLVTPLPPPLSNSPSVHSKTDAIFNEQILHSPTSARLTQHDLNNIDLENHCQHIKYPNLPFFQIKNSSRFHIVPQ